MSDLSIAVDGLGKQYEIGERSDYRTIRDAVSTTVARPIRRFRGDSNRLEIEARPTVWALRNVSFEAHPGEVVGLIGANGAGKSTLLKILTRITEPTEGVAELRGRVGSLLEVGTGFHGELTGRENIYLNGAILGMTKKEIASHFDEIVAFAEVEQFLETPVKHYSSGMYVRLGFAVAAHLNLDIMLVDEVLAVGDAAFQKKCLGKMDEVARGGRTIIFVSHSMAAISQLCTRAVLIDHGEVALDGRPADVVPRYLESTSSARPERRWDSATAPQDDRLRIDMVCVRSAGQCTEHVDINCPIEITVEFTVLTARNPAVAVIVDITDSVGTTVLRSAGRFSEAPDMVVPQQPGPYRAVCTLPPNVLNDQRYYVTVYIGRTSYYYVPAERVVAFTVQEVGGLEEAVTHEAWPGLVRLPLDWQLGRVEQPVDAMDARGPEVLG